MVGRDLGQRHDEGEAEIAIGSQSPSIASVSTRCANERPSRSIFRRGGGQRRVEARTISSRARESLIPKIRP